QVTEHTLELGERAMRYAHVPGRGGEPLYARDRRDADDRHDTERRDEPGIDLVSGRPSHHGSTDRAAAKRPVRSGRTSSCGADDRKCLRPTCGCKYAHPASAANGRTVPLSDGRSRMELSVRRLPAWAAGALLLLPSLSPLRAAAQHHRPEVQGMHAAVVADHPLAAAEGMNVLRRGGNAVDAAITMAAVLAVVRPHMSGVGGDAFILMREGRSGRVRALNGSGRSPAAATT